MSISLRINSQAAAAVGLDADQLDALTRDLICRTSFADLMATDEHYHPTMRVDIDPRYAQLARAFNEAAELMGQSRRAWTPAYSDKQRKALEQFGLRAA